jgi:catechol 2,3-dioxygenase-like lactoylglutathione lyase family enzyme
VLLDSADVLVIIPEINSEGEMTAITGEKAVAPLGEGFLRKLRGVHHLVFNTDDMKMTIDFYSGVLGMPLVGAIKVEEGVDRGNPKFPNIRHYFFDMGNDSMLAFFEIPKGAKPRGDRDAIGTMQHVSFVATPDIQLELKERLEKHGYPCDGPVRTSPGSQSIYFFDPNGIRLEASSAPAQGDNQRVMANRRQTKAQARLELATLCDDPQWIESAIAAFKD